MDFVRSYFSTNEPLTRWTLFTSVFDWSHSKPVKKWGKKCSTGQRFICTEVTSYKIHILAIVQLCVCNHTSLWMTNPIFKYERILKVRRFVCSIGVALLHSKPTPSHTYVVEDFPLFWVTRVVNRPRHQLLQSRVPNKRL